MVVTRVPELVMKIGQIAATGNALYNRISNFPFIFGLVLIEVLVWISGPSFFPNWSPGYGNLILTYLVMTIVFYIFSKAQTKLEIQKPSNQSVYAFFLFFVGTTIVLSFLILFGVLKSGTIPQELFWQTVLIQVVVVATAEELMFRGVLLPYLGIIISSFLFAIWHSYAYGIIYYQLAWDNLTEFNWSALALAFVIGVILAVVAKNKRWGLPGAIGIHSAYNAVILGALSLNGGAN